MHKSIIPLAESDNVEFKTAFNEAVIETLVAFSNTKGGTVYIGITDNSDIMGVMIGKESFANWVNEVKGKTIPQIIPDIKTVNLGGKTVVLMNVNEYPVKPVSTRGRYFKRVGNSNHLLSVSEVVDLHLQSLNSSWDAFPDPVHSIDDISMDKVQLSIDMMTTNRLTIAENPLSFLHKYNLIRVRKLTNAAYLLFKRDETAETTIELGRFQTEIIIKDSKRSKSDVIAQIDQVIDFVKKHINKQVIITDKPHNVQKWQYPMEAIREIIVNMVVHRDYRLASDSIVKIFDHKIEFYNPGRLPDTISIEDLMSNNYRSTPRNKFLADFFKDLGLIEKYGSGIQRIINYFKEEHLPAPVFQNISDGFMVTVYSGSYAGLGDKLGDRLGDKLGDNQRLILESLKNNPFISLSQLSKSIGISQTAIEKNISKLKEIGLITRIGPAKGGHWEVLE